MKIGEQSLNHSETISRLNHQIHRTGESSQDTPIRLSSTFERSHTGRAHSNHPSLAGPNRFNNGW
ncbi:MAG: Uncharacterised protein [Synechococcus sp. CC9902]|nr:MAG: Uncharacterised protein [Synechococcus sp. CC9902]